MYPVFQQLQGKRVILASGSPRRLDIFLRVGFQPECIPSGFPEDVDWRPMGPTEYVKFNSRSKVDWLVNGDIRDFALIIGSDTVVTCQGEVLEKPRDRQHAVEMLRSLSGKTIQIVTGVHFRYTSSDGTIKTHEFVDIAEVDMLAFDDAMINGYLDLGNGMDNAGALAIQEGGVVLCKSMRGDFFSAVGFPMSRAYQELQNILPDIQ